MTKASKEGQRKAPILRFKGFTDAWEQRQLKEVADIVGGGTPSTDFSEYWNGNINWFTPNEINSQIYFSESKRKISNLGLKKSSAKLLPANRSILFTSRATIGEMGILTQDATTNQGFQSLVLHNEVIPYFIFSMKSALKRQAIKKASGSTFLEISKREVEKLKIIIPSEKEQKKVSMLFKSIDNLITLYERKLKLLSQVKKYFLDNLFAEKEYPNLRFKGFTDAWEQRELLKVCKKEDNKRIPIKEQERKEGNTPYFGANGIQGYIDGYTHDGTNILIAEDGANNVRNYPIKLITGKIWVNNHAHVLKVNTKINNGNFLVGVIKKINFYRYLVGSSRYKLTAESLNQVKIKIAKQSEQEKIGELLKNIEELLTLYENKQQHFTEIKKTLLNTMFI